MLSAVIICAILIVVYCKKATITIDIYRQKTRDSNECDSLEEYIAVAAGMPLVKNSGGLNFVLWLVYSFGLLLVAVFSEAAFEKLFDAPADLFDIPTNLIIYLCLFAYAPLGGLFLAVIPYIRKNRLQPFIKEATKYISWVPSDSSLMTADGFFFDIISCGGASDRQLAAVRNFRDRCIAGGSFDFMQTELYLKSLNSLRKMKYMQPAYGELFKRIEAAQAVNEVMAAAELPEAKIGEELWSTEYDIVCRIKEKANSGVFHIAINGSVKSLHRSDIEQIVKGYRALHYHEWTEDKAFNEMLCLAVGHYLLSNNLNRRQLSEIGEFLEKETSGRLSELIRGGLLVNYRWVRPARGPCQYNVGSSYHSEEVLFEGNDMYSYDGEFRDY